MEYIFLFQTYKFIDILIFTINLYFVKFRTRKIESRRKIGRIGRIERFDHSRKSNTKNSKS